MPSHLVSSLLRYGCAFFSVALAIGCRLLLDPVLGVQSDGEHLVNFVHLPFALVLLAVLVNAYYGGFRPALTAALLGAVALDFFFLAPRWSFYLAGLDQQVGMVLFLLTGLGIAVLGGAMHSAQRSLIVANESLETRISERTKELTEANEKLRLSEERNRLQVEGISSYGIFMLDPAGNVTTWNTGAVRIMGYNAEEIIGHHLSRLYTPEDVAGGTPQRDLQLAVEKGSREDERSCVRKDGSQFWSAVTITAMFDPSRRPIGFVTVTRDISRQKELAIALEDAARFNRATLDGLAAHIAIIDEDGVIAATNEPWEKFGVADGLTVGRGSVGDNYLNVCDRSSGPHAQVSPDVAASIRAVLACEVPQFALEYPCHSPTEQRWFIVRVTPFPGTERRRVIIAHENITERKAAEEALQAEHDRFEKIVSAVPVVICSYRERPDGTACFPFANAAIEQIYGFRPEELEQDATPIFARMHAEDAGRIRTTLDESARTMSPWRGEFRVNNPTRGEIWVEGHVIPVAEPNGDTLWQGYIADITERKRTEAALRESEQRLRLFFEHTPIALAMFDDQMRYVAVSNRWKSDFGFSPDESMIGLSHYEVFPDLLDHWKRAHARGLAGEVVRADDDRFVDPNGLERWFKWEVRPWWRSSDAIGGIVVVVEDVSGRKRSEAEQQKLVALIELSRDFIGVADLQGRLTFLNASGRKMIGAGDADDVGRLHFTDYIPSEGREFFLGTVIRTTREQGHWEGEMQLRHMQTGAIIDVFRSTFALIDTTGQVCGYATVTRDITEQKRSQEALRSSEERLRLMIEGVSDYAIFMLDPGGHILTWSRGAEQIHGYAADDIIGRHYSCLFTPESNASGLPQRELQLAATKGRTGVDGWRVRKNGSRFWANGTLAALYDENRVVKGFSKITRDLTAKRHNDELLHSVLDHTLDAIICINERGTITLMNSAGETVFGHTVSEVVGENVSMLMPEPHQSQHDGYLANYLHTGVAQIFGVGREVQGLRKDGSTFPAELAVTEFRLDDQRHFVGIVRDITEQKRLEALFHQSQKMEAFGQLAGGVAHDFNNLLTVISGFSELVMEMLPPDDEKRSPLEQIRQAGERAAGLTRQLLAFSRQQVLEPRILDLNGVVNDIGKMLRRLIGEDIRLDTVLRPNLPMVKIDPGQIEQVIINLAVNARDAMPQGGKLSIETSDIELDESYVSKHPDARPGRFVLLSVKDAGTGMTPEVQARVFEPFFTTKGVGKGTGLGLAVVHGIVKQSGGIIDISSKVGVGTTFKIYLPAVQERPSSMSNPGPARSSRGRETILLVEDDESVREFAIRSLQGFGYTVLEASGGNAAIQLAASHGGKIDLLVTDVVMPGLGGRQLAEALLAEHPGLKVLFMSGYTDDAIVRHGILQSNAAFLQKPFTPKSLAMKVREVLEQQRRPTNSSQAELRAEP